MMKLDLQMFGGNGGAAGIGRDLPNHLKSDRQHFIEMIVTDGTKVDKRQFAGADWEIEEEVMRILNRHSMSYSEYLNQRKLSIVTYYTGDTESFTLDQRLRNMDPETRKSFLKQYYERKKRFAKRYREFRKT